MKFYTVCVISSLLVTQSWSLTEDEIAQFVSRPYVEHNTGLQGTVSVTYGNDPTKLILQANGIPDHDTGTFPNADNPNSITAQTYRWRINRNPTYSEATSCLPMGPIGMAVNGVALYNPYTITCCDAGVEELDLFDMCTGHPGPSGGYHYHIYPTCLEDIICNTPSSIIGVAFDGFPIYGPIDENGRQLTQGDLDECNGRTDSNGRYKYHIISEFPYIMGCYHGQIVDTSISSNCQCTEPVEVCTEFGGNTGTGGTGGGGGGRPPPHPQARKKRSTTRLFQCCTDESSCSVMRIFVPEEFVSHGDEGGNGAATNNISMLALILSTVSIMLGGNLL